MKFKSLQDILDFLDMSDKGLLRLIIEETHDKGVINGNYKLADLTNFFIAEVMRYYLRDTFEAKIFKEKSSYVGLALQDINKDSDYIVFLNVVRFFMLHPNIPAINRLKPKIKEWLDNHNGIDAISQLDIRTYLENLFKEGEENEEDQTVIR